MPRNRNAPMLIIAIIIGAIAFMLTLKATRPKEEGGGGIMPKPSVAALTKDIEIGTAIRKEDLDLIPAPDNVSIDMLFRDPQAVVGKVTNRFLSKGAVIRSIDLVSAQDNLAGLIPEGYQAMTVPVTLPASLANLIQVGNRVDILLTYTTGAGTQFKSVTLMKNVKVIGVGSTQSSSEIQLSIAVTPEGAKTLAYSLKRGTLNVAVRSLSESDKEQPEHFFTLSELFKDQEIDTGQITKENKQPLTEEIEIVRGLSKETYRFTNGKVDAKS